MSTIGTQTQSFTTADIRKVVENFAADLSMMAQFTGTYSREHVAKIISDLNVFAAFKYLVQVMVMHKDKDGNKLNASIYRISECATGWTTERPGNNRWQRTPDGTLWVIATMTVTWNEKTDEAKSAFVTAQGLNWAWSPTTQDVTLVGLGASTGQKYASNGYGWERVNYAK
jgi:hypothetical protein